jgi:hypothetical protein
MGAVKDSMKTTDLTEKKDEKSVLGVFKKKSKTPEADAETFADLVQKAEDKLTALVNLKESELKTESGRETYNRKALAVLKAMSFHLDEITNLAGDYSELT